MPSTEDQAFLDWFKAHNGKIDTDSVTLKDFGASEGGRGLVALRDLPENYDVFSIPRSLVLSTRTSSLPSKIGASKWREYGLHKGWSGLILCMLWEAAQGPASKWNTYFVSMPSKFDVPILWEDRDLSELQGTSVVDKLGKENAEHDYNEKILRVVKAFPHIFPTEAIPQHYSLEKFHIMGCRIMSRSFTLEIQEGEEGEGQSNDNDENEIQPDDGNTSMGSAMDVDHEDDPKQTSEEQDEDEDEEDETEVVMVPLADFLNARYQTENVKLFYEPQSLKMVTTRPIQAGEQIWNTYGDLPNAELLRRFGHTDLVDLGSGKTGNPGDVVELRADLVLQSIIEVHPEFENANLEERIDWWLEAGGDDVFVLDYDELPQDFISFTRLVMNDSEWQKARSKERPPKPTIDKETLEIIQRVLTKRTSLYPTTLNEDEELASNLEALPLNHKHALIVRIGEKRILAEHLDKIGTMLKASIGSGDRKRRREDGTSGNKKKQKQ
ncbi:hypothetical protein CVT24_001591 [Panaeolus cyanescens]|uniref:Ribosomal lysine N-methyltransferase 4 n=1 Tax=Panaeolus cyanescens TaxID=181874 RepID=A0A409YFG4_9AGAR|nr:hypothetical protein CVT24_001591 [Panaeolus cyanescens]